MSVQKIFGLIVTEQKVPLLEKPEEKDQCYLCGFTFGDEDCVLVLVNEDLNERRKTHQKCLQSHIQLISKDTKIALVCVETNEVIAYTTNGK